MLTTPEVLKTIEHSTRTKLRATISDYFPAYENPYKLTKKQIYDIAYCFNINLMTSIIETGDTYLLPETAGAIGIEKFITRPAKWVRNYRLFNEEGVRANLRNTHSGGYMAMFFWDTNRIVPAIPKLLLETNCFRPCRFVRRHLAHQIINKNSINLYYEH